MANDIVQSSHDWLSSPRTNALAWWIPKAAIVAALFFPSPARTGMWIIALVWMGTACKRPERSSARPIEQQNPGRTAGPGGSVIDMNVGAVRMSYDAHLAHLVDETAAFDFTEVFGWSF